MTELTDDQAIRLLREAMPVLDAARQPEADLWPRVRHRIERRTSPLPTADWILALVLVGLCLLRPSLLGVLLLHF
jgi:hypothetical protein